MSIPASARRLTVFREPVMGTSPSIAGSTTAALSVEKSLHWPKIPSALIGTIRTQARNIRAENLTARQIISRAYKSLHVSRSARVKIQVRYGDRRSTRTGGSQTRDREVKPRPSNPSRRAPRSLAQKTRPSEASAMLSRRRKGRRVDTATQQPEHPETQQRLRSC